MAGGRPRKNIGEEEFKKLCGLQCTLEEIAGFFDCSEDTVENWCKRELKMRFSDAFKKYSAAGKLSLRRTQFRLAEKSAAMAIFLGKQYLGQRDQQDIEISTNKDESIRAMEEYFKNAREDYQSTP